MAHGQRLSELPPSSTWLGALRATLFTKVVGFSCQPEPGVDNEGAGAVEVANDQLG